MKTLFFSLKSLSKSHHNQTYIWDTLWGLLDSLFSTFSFCVFCLVFVSNTVFILLLGELWSPVSWYRVSCAVPNLFLLLWIVQSVFLKGRSIHYLDLASPRPVIPSCSCPLGPAELLVLV